MCPDGLIMFYVLSLILLTLLIFDKSLPVKEIIIFVSLKKNLLFNTLTPFKFIWKKKTLA